MKELRLLLLANILFLFLVLITPTLLVKQEQQEMITVQRETGVEQVSLEEYVTLVVAAEMPAVFHKEALKAQAVASRTYILKSGSDMVTDTTKHQVYQNKEELREKWGTAYEKNLAKISAAVQATKGQVLTYEEELITASFFSTSNGYTESAKDVWGADVPYLQSVKSMWDKQVKTYLEERIISVAELEKKLNVQVNNDNTVGTILTRTKTNRVAQVAFGEKKISGKDVREKLGLRSTDFTWEQLGENIFITTKGYGHGVGMSQYGANEMAASGASYQEILQYYYQGVKITKQ